MRVRGFGGKFVRDWVRNFLGKVSKVLCKLSGDPNRALAREIGDSCRGCSAIDQEIVPVISLSN